MVTTEGGARRGAVRRRSLVAAVAVILFLWAGCVTGAAYVFGFIRVPVGGGESFNLLHWEATRLVTYAVNRSAGLVARQTASNDEVQRYFDLLSQARAAHQRGLQAGSGTEANTNEANAEYAREQTLRSRADRLRVRVEARYEQAVSDAARRAGLVEPLPVFGSVTVLWPPVATGFSMPPHILLISPRNRIALTDSRLLSPDLSTPAAQRIEQSTERHPNTSALVVQIGGLAAYPSIADEDDTPLGLMQTVAHEWMHAYLAFHPLGARYGVSGDMALINETVADLVGRELGARAFDSLHLPTPPPGPPSPQPAIDFNATMHTLRLEVDQLLEDGKVAEAEQRMNETQQLLAANGYNIRRINQAYFAFYGSYATSPASSNPLGTRVQLLRRLSPSLAAFVHAVQGVSKPADVDQLLRRASTARAS